MPTAGPMTHDELMSLPPTIDLDTANGVLGIGRTTGYALAKRGQYPVRLLPGSRAYRVSRYDLYRHLGVVVEESTSEVA
ncbi:integrase [Streptomyces melanogenes]|uniref:Integrase n=1 Tax=Streptomyces melanogenes TaxID=67326 RepID=A0ABZ1XLN5_9ACTN|nr:integrase [Streptomyces melanogenes]